MSHLLQKLCGRIPLLHQRVCLVTRFAFPTAARKAMLGRVLYHIVDMDASWASGNTTAEAGVKPFYCVGYIWWLRPIELPTCGLLSSTGALDFSHGQTICACGLRERAMSSGCLLPCRCSVAGSREKSYTHGLKRA